MSKDIQLICADSLRAMKVMPDDKYDWAIVDPPYGIGESSKNFASRSVLGKSNKYKVKYWDSEKSFGIDYGLRAMRKRKDFPTQNHAHNALYDAKWNRRLHVFLDGVMREKATNKHPQP